MVKQYGSLKMRYPNVPILVRERANIAPKFVVRLGASVQPSALRTLPRDATAPRADKGVEKEVSAAGLSVTDIATKLDQLSKQ